MKNNLSRQMEKKIMARLDGLKSDSPRFIEALHRIGMALEREAKLNIRRKQIVDTGALLNSIRYRIGKDSNGSFVEFGSYGVPYAAVHEFGFKGPASVKAHQRLISQAFGNPIEQRMVNVRGHTRQMNVKARPYIRPAIMEVRQEMREILRGMIK